jgi:hypothetical protein
LAIALAGVFFGGPDHVFWPSVVAGLLISPLWVSLGFDGYDSSETRRSLFDDSDPITYESPFDNRSCDPNHISNGGTSLVEWSDM